MSGRGFACSGGCSLGEISRAAREAEDAGYSSLWVTVLAGTTDPAAVLGAALGETDKIDVGLGLVPLDAFPASSLAEQLGGLSSRVILGLGVGRQASHRVELLTEAVSELRAVTPGVRLAVGSYGPRILRAAGAEVDAILLNWMTRERLGWATGQVDAGARAVRRPSPRPIYAYVPVAVGPDAAEELDRAFDGIVRHPSQRRHREALPSGSSIGLSIDLTNPEPPPPAEVFDWPVVPIINPTGNSNDRERRALLQRFRPGGASD